MPACNMLAAVPRASVHDALHAAAAFLAAAAAAVHGALHAAAATAAAVHAVCFHCSPTHQTVLLKPAGVAAGKMSACAAQRSKPANPLFAQHASPLATRFLDPCHAGQLVQLLVAYVHVQHNAQGPANPLFAHHARTHVRQMLHSYHPDQLVQLLLACANV
eukprot:1158392-Pelagomonas_calceolata.AAC.17